MSIQKQLQEALFMASSIATALCFLVLAQNSLAQQSMFSLIYYEFPNFAETFQNAFELLLLYAL